ncbi:MAG: phage tail protein [Campylobacteraceae bacterium]
MIFSLGGFKFEMPVLSESLEKTTTYGISSQNRFNNHPVHFSSSKADEVIEVSGKTLPLQGAKNTALKELYKLASAQIAYSLTSGSGLFYGKFVIKTIKETQTLFLPSGEFLAQSFVISLERDY